MKTAATIEVAVPENRQLELEFPPEVPAGRAKLLVMVEEPVEGPDDQDFDEVELVEVHGFLVARSKKPRDCPLEAFDHRPL